MSYISGMISVASLESCLKAICKELKLANDLKREELEARFGNLSGYPLDFKNEID